MSGRTQSLDVVMRGAACSYCPRKGQRLDGSHLRIFALELKEQLAQTLAALVTSILTQPRRRQDEEEASEPPLRLIKDVLQQVMRTHTTQKKFDEGLKAHDQHEVAGKEHYLFQKGDVVGDLNNRKNER